MGDIVIKWLQAHCTEEHTEVAGSGGVQQVVLAYPSTDVVP